MSQVDIEKPLPNCQIETTIIRTNLETGEVIFEKTFRGSRLGSGWVMMFTDVGMEIVAKCPSPATLRVFLYLSMGQTFSGGMVTTKRAVERYLGICHKTCSDAFDWLRKNMIVQEWRHNGCTEFLVNPRYVSIGNFNERMQLWNARWNARPFFSSKSYQRKKSAEFERQQKASS